jgi:hypothetical protein
MPRRAQARIALRQPFPYRMLLMRIGKFGVFRLKTSLSAE